jgi:hypothetical protein
MQAAITDSLYRSGFLQDDVRIFLSHNQVREPIAVHEQQVGKITFLLLAKFVPQADQLAAARLPHGNASPGEIPSKSAKWFRPWALSP